VTHPDSRFYRTTEIPNTVEKMAGIVQDKLNREWALGLPATY